jgi:hypothetical protein
MLHRPLASLTVRLSLASAALLGTLACALSAQAATPVPPLTVYSAAQEAAALQAVADANTALDKLDQKMLLAYPGAGVPVVRMERVEQGAVLGSLTAVSTSPLKTTGSRAARRIASFEPLTAACGLANEPMNTLQLLSEQIGALLEKRNLAGAADRADWLAQGHLDGTQRLASVHELDCAPVRRGLAETLPLIQNAYAQLHTAWAADPTEAAPAAAKTSAAAARR